jgi:hypothetical protein
MCIGLCEYSAQEKQKELGKAFIQKCILLSILLVGFLYNIKNYISCFLIYFYFYFFFIDFFWFSLILHYFENLKLAILVYS